MADKIKFWYSDTHYTNPPGSFEAPWCLNVEGKQYLYTATTDPNASEPFPGAFEKFPDYRELYVAPWSGIQEIAKTAIPSARENTLTLISDRPPGQVGSIKSEESHGEESAAELLAKLEKTEREELPGWLSLLLLAALVYGSWWWVQKNYMDPGGWDSHTVESTITAQTGWMVGESKSCLSIPLDAQIARAVGKEPGYAFFYVNCDDGPERKIQVTFWGAENQQKSKVAYWNCTRTTDSFTCKQTGADSK